MSSGPITINLFERHHAADGSGGSAKNISDGGGGGPDPVGAGVARLETEIKDHKKEVQGELAEVRKKVDGLRDKLDTEAGNLKVIDGRIQEISRQIPSVSKQWLLVIGMIVVGAISGATQIWSVLSSRTLGSPSSAPPNAVQMPPRQ